MEGPSGHPCAKSRAAENSHTRIRGRGEVPWCVQCRLFLLLDFLSSLKKKSSVFLDCFQLILRNICYFKTIFSNSVVEHIPDIDGLIKNCSKVLDKDGSLFLTTYSEKFTTCLSNNLGEEIATEYNKSLTHVSLLSYSDWENVFSKYGLTIKKIEYYLTCKALIQMRFFSSNIFHLIEILLGDIFWLIYRSSLREIVNDYSENNYTFTVD